MKKIEPNFIISQYRSGIKSYSDFTKEISLWDSENFVFKKYIKKTDTILDLGCGTGRTTFPLFQEGYNKIIGVDLTPEMIDEAKKLNEYFETNINFKIGDATNLDFENLSFNTVIFSFNGLMSIPNQSNRNTAIGEINRVLKESGIFIFTTHDRNKEEQYLDFWKEEKKKWDAGNQDPILHEFGDLIAQSKNESRDIFIHIPNQNEITNWLNQNGFTVIETFYRSEQFKESKEVKSKSGECRFWVAKKNNFKIIEI